MAAGDDDTTHVYCPSFQTPKGRVDDDDGGAFRSKGVALREPFAKYSGPKRLVHEIEYGFRLSLEVKRLEPDVVISANTPLVAAVVFHLFLAMARIPVALWQQDIYSVAMAKHLERGAGLLGRAVGAFLKECEKRLLRSSDHVVVISDDFLDTLRRWKVDLENVSVVENWAPLDELPRGDRPNQWSERQGIERHETVFLYAGTLGLKHEPSLLLDLARAFKGRKDVRVVVASEGIGATWLDEARDDDDPIELLPFQPYEELPHMLASADVLLVLLEEDAGAFSVPSKVLTYHCAGRPILGAMPQENLASRIIRENGSGVTVPPGDGQMFVAEAKRLADDPSLRAAMGESGRQYAEATFDIERIVDRFEKMVTTATSTTER